MNLRRLHALGGVLFGLPFAAAYLWTIGGAARSREVFLERAPSSLGATILLAVLAIGALLALVTLRGPLPGLPQHASLQRLALVPAIGTAAAVAALAWWPLVRGDDAIVAYHQLRATLPYASASTLAALGLAFVALHLELSLHAFVDAFGSVRRPETRRWLGVALAALAIAFFVLALNPLAFFVTGAPLFGSEPAPERLFIPEFAAEEAP
ncbi:MAG: hypothetical protein MUE69_27080 [Myxococcota bacterium]|nr:hypothetical protein [Myxococcota bacterium]